LLSFPAQDVIAACKFYGHQLKLLPGDLDGTRVMLAIAAVESGGADPVHAGHNCGPRLEPSYAEGGAFFLRSPIQQQLVEQHGSKAAMSYGPWQMMFPNFTDGLSPQELEANLQTCATEFVRQFNRFAARWRFVTLDQVGQVWNTGREIPDHEYTDKLHRAYEATALVLCAPEKA
jgi:hypothetical protein